MHLVLLHGWGTTGAVWRHQAQALGNRCTVHTPTWPRWEAAWIADFLARFPLAETVAVGWSLGGMLLVEALAGTGLKPAGLILVGVPAVFCRREDYPWGQPPAAVRAMRRALQKEARKVLEDFASACLATPEAAFAEEAKSLFGCNPEKKYLVAGLDYLLTADLRPLLTMLPVSPVIVQGEKDRVVPPEQARYLFECLPGSQLVILSDTGHLPFVTQAAKFNEIVKATTVGDKGQGPR